MIRAGAAARDITPRAGTHLSGSGMGERRPAQSVLDPLWARAAVFETGERRLCILALDLCIVTENFTRRVRESAAKLGFAPEAVMVHATQTHSAPSTGCFMLDPDFPLALTPETEYLTGSETPYIEHALARSVDAIAAAAAALVPVRLGWASAARTDLAFNRRAVMRDGSVGMPWILDPRAQPFGPTGIRYMEGPVDPEVGVLAARAEDMRLVTALLHHTCHPVNGFATPSAYRAVSADWPGAWAAGLAREFGPRCVPLVVNGCCGNINPWDPFDPAFVPDHRRMGAALADTAARLVRSMSFRDSDALAWSLERVPLPYREVPAERAARVREILDAHPAPRWRAGEPSDIDPEWFHAASTRSIEHCRRRAPEFPYEIQVFRIGDTAMVGLPGEPFVEGQLALKLRSPAALTLVAHDVSHYVGYLPTREACARGGHEANALCTYWAKLAPGALETVVDRAAAMAARLFA